MTSGDVVGVDVGATTLHAVRVDGRRRRLVDATVLPVDDPAGVVAWGAGAAVAAIDGPDRASPGAHAGDETLAPKFRGGRTGEVALGRHHGHWVSWVTPPELVPGTWMAVAAALHQAFRSAGTTVLEVYPHAAFRELAGGARLPSKRSPQGTAARVALATAEVGPVPHLAMWSHDGLDALAAAVVAADHVAGVAVAAGPRAGDPGTADGPDDDGSRIWLPRRRG